MNKFRSVFQVKDSPHRIALAFSVGVFMGISPLLGLHTIGAFFLAWLFRLNKLVALAGVCLNNPWTIVPISSFCLWIGARLIGMDQILPVIDWQDVGLLHMIKAMTPLLLPFFLGSFFVAAIAAVASYFIVHYLTRKYRKIHHAP